MFKSIAIGMLLLGGCAARPVLTPPPDGGELPVPRSGVYDVAVAQATGDCLPATVSGPLPPLQQGIIDLDANTLRVQMPEVTAGKAATFALRDLLGYKWQQSYPSCGAHVSLDITAISVQADALTLVRSELWSDTASARAGVDGGTEAGEAGCDYVPAQDCGSSVTLQYNLAEACESPCRVVISGTPTSAGYPSVSCVCADAGAD
jgi:hypothetical protein